MAQLMVFAVISFGLINMTPTMANGTPGWG
jgi:hypothetical protein